MASEVTLPIAVQIDRADVLRPGNLMLPDAGEDRTTLPGHLPREPNVDRHQAANNRCKLRAIRRRQQIGHNGHYGPT
jgi:hypothetical protein